MKTNLKNFLILGDSYSTFEGYIPNGYDTYYNTQGSDNTGIISVEEVWWKKLISATGANLILNDSWSGSSVSYTGYGGTDCSATSSFIYRFKKLKEEGFFKKNNVDTVIIFGGTNDSWSDAPLGEIKLSDFEERDLYSVCPAICYLIKTVKEELPCANIIFVINTELKPEIGNAVIEASKCFGTEYLQLENITKYPGMHPNAQGMTDICNQILSFVKK